MRFLPLFLTVACAVESESVTLVTESQTTVTNTATGEVNEFFGSCSDNDPTDYRQPLAAEWVVSQVSSTSSDFEFPTLVLCGETAGAGIDEIGFMVGNGDSQVWASELSGTVLSIEADQARRQVLSERTHCAPYEGVCVTTWASDVTEADLSVSSEQVVVVTFSLPELVQIEDFMDGQDDAIKVTASASGQDGDLVYLAAVGTTLTVTNNFR